MADIFTLIDEYKGLMDEKDRLKDATTKNNKILEEKRKELAQAIRDAYGESWKDIPEEERLEKMAEFELQKKQKEVENSVRELR